MLFQTHWRKQVWNQQWNRGVITTKTLHLPPSWHYTVDTRCSAVLYHFQHSYLANFFVVITPLFLCRFQICFRQCVWNNHGQISLIYTTHLSSKLAKIKLEWPWPNVPRSKISSPMDVPSWYYRWKCLYIYNYSPQFRDISKMAKLSGHPV